MPLREQSENMFYSIDIGPVHFIAVSTEFYYYTNYGMKMVANQYKWLVEDLKVWKQVSVFVTFQIKICTLRRKQPARKTGPRGPGS